MNYVTVVWKAFCLTGSGEEFFFTSEVKAFEHVKELKGEWDYKRCEVQ